MNVNERIQQFAEDLTQRKLLIENRIAILKTDQPENAQRIEQLEAVKKNITEMQESYFDHFYNELTHQAEGGAGAADRVGEQSNVINLDETMRDDQPGDHTASRPAPDLDKLLNNIKNIQDQHRNE